MLLEHAPGSRALPGVPDPVPTAASSADDTARLPALRRSATG